LPPFGRKTEGEIMTTLKWHYDDTMPDCCQAVGCTDKFNGLWYAKVKIGRKLFWINACNKHKAAARRSDKKRGEKMKQPIETTCSLCKKKITIAYQFQGDGEQYLLLWDNISAHSIGEEEEIPFPSQVFCQNCIPKVRKWLKKIKPEKEAAARRSDKTGKGGKR
jgi:hypothetical protein